MLGKPRRKVLVAIERIGWRLYAGAICKFSSGRDALITEIRIKKLVQFPYNTLLYVIMTNLFVGRFRKASSSDHFVVSGSLCLSAACLYSVIP